MLIKQLRAYVFYLQLLKLLIANNMDFLKVGGFFLCYAVSFYLHPIAPTLLSS